MRQPMMFLYGVPILLIAAGIAAAAASDSVTLKPNTIRTELRIGKSLRPQDEHEISVTGTNGSPVNIIVKKRDPKQQQSTLVPANTVIFDSTSQKNRDIDQNDLTMSSSTEPSHASTLFKRYSIAVNIAAPNKNEAAKSMDNNNPKLKSKDEKLIETFVKHISKVNRAKSPREYRPQLLTIDQLRVEVPEPVVISSEPVNFNADRMSKKLKHARNNEQLMEIDDDGIPVIEGIRMPDDEEDKVRTWRQGKVVNGILFPYEKGYKPKKAIELNGDYGQLFYVSKDFGGTGRSAGGDEVDNEGAASVSVGRSFGPFTKSDNFKSKPKSTGPFTVDDNHRIESSVRFADDDRKPLGPFSIKDNSRVANSKLIDYIKTINDREYRRRDFFNEQPASDHVRFGDEVRETAQPKIQRRMLENIGEPVYAPSRYYSKAPSKLIEGERSPIMEYAHPEWAMKAAPETSTTTRKPKIQYYTTDTKTLPPITSQYKNIQPFRPQHYQKNYYPAMMGPVPQASAQKAQVYPYGTYLAQTANNGNEPFYMKIAKRMHDGVQSGFDIFIRPIMEAGKTITQNLGFRTNFRSIGKSMTVDSNSGEDEAALSSDFLSAMDEIGANGAVENKIRIKRGPLIPSIRKRRAIDSDNFDTNDGENKLVDNSGSLSNRLKDFIKNTNWKNTACAKRVFCEVMIQQTPDQIAIMEKKMLSILPQRGLSFQTNNSHSIRVFRHLSDVTRAIQQRNCARFICEVEQ